PTRRTITVDMTEVAAPAYGSWYDPTRGTFTPIAGSPLANTGIRTFTPPGNNGDGDGDWVLVLETTSVPPDSDPPSMPTGLSATIDSSSQITLSWSASTDDVGVAGYRVLPERRVRPRDAVDRVRRCRTVAQHDLYPHGRGLRLREQPLGGIDATPRHD